MPTLADADLDIATDLLGPPPFRQPAYRLGHPTDECPTCGSGQMCWIMSEDLESKYLCETCGRCWTLDPAGAGAGAGRVNPLRCPGCSHREACFEQLRTEIPPWCWQPTDQ
jgi:ribosomal protein S27E